MLISNLKDKHPILFYDGYCYLCSSTIRLLIRFDMKKKLRFISLQKGLMTPKINKIIGIYNINESIIFLSNGKIHTKSNAIIKVIKTLGGAYKLISIFYILPRPIRDFIYDFIAKYRYRIFGKRDNCHLPKAEFTDRFL